MEFYLHIPPLTFVTHASQVLRASPPASVASVLNAYGFCLGTLPPATFGACDPGRHIDARLLTFRARAADQDHAASTPGTAWPGTRAPAKLISREGAGPPISMPSLTFDASTTTPHRVSPAERFWKRLPGPHLTGSSPAFSLDAHHDSRQLTQLQGGLTPTPAGPTPEGQRSSISRTAPLSRVTYMDTPSAFVTHTPRHLGVTSGRPGRSGR